MSAQLNFFNSPHNPCLYKFRNEHTFSAIILYVEDLPVAGSSPVELARVKLELGKRVKMKDLGNVQDFLSIHATRYQPRKLLNISQSAYIDKTLNRFRLSQVRTMSTPMDSSNGACSDFQAVPADATYRSATGCLICLTVCTRPDIGLNVVSLSQYCKSPLQHHWTAVKRVYLCIKATKYVVLS